MLRDILKDTWAYQEILQEGREEGLEKGLEEGLEKGREKELQRSRDVLADLVQMHFPNLLQEVNTKAEAIHDPDVMQRFILRMLHAQTEEQARHVLERTE